MKSCFEKRLKSTEVEKLKSSLSTFQPFNLSTWAILSTFQLFNLSTAQDAAAFEGREILRRPDMCNVDTVDTVAWYSQESVRLEVEPWRCGKRVEIPEGATAAWVVADEGGTNWLVRYDAALASNRCAFVLGAGEGNLPSGHDYTGYVSLLSGTNILGVLDRHEVAVMGQAADGGAEISPEGGCWGSLLQRMADAEADIHGIAGDLATNALEIAELEESVANLQTNVAARFPAEIDSVEGNTWYSSALLSLVRGLWTASLSIGEGDRIWTSLPDVDGIAAGVTSNTARIDSLYGECVGGFRWPNYFAVAGYETGVIPGTVTNAAVATQAVHNVIVETVESEQGGASTRRSFGRVIGMRAGWSGRPSAGSGGSRRRFRRKIWWWTATS